MSGTVACADCHDPANPDALATVAKACSMCHSDQGAKNLAAWKKSLKAGRTQVNALAQQARLTIEMLNRRHRDTSAFKKRFGRIQERIDFIEKARGVHNQPAASEQYKRAAAELQALINAMEGLPPGTDY